MDSRSKADSRLLMRSIVAITGSMLILLAQFPAEGQVLRLADERRQLSPETLAANGLVVVESRRLRLVTDLPLESVKDLPHLADALFDELERQLGQLPPTAAGTDFQVTGFLIEVKERFANASLLPAEQFNIRHGRHLGYEFWMNNQTSPYYRRHLLLHEFIHCFMMCENGMHDIPPLWYTEGIAEYFATHQFEQTVSRSRFGILPPTVDGFEGWGRIAEVRGTGSTSTTPARPMLINEILHPASNQFTDERNYAHAWALVWLIRNHPELKEPFSGLSRVRTNKEHHDASDKIPTDIWKRLAIVWPLFLESLVEGFDTQRSFPSLKKNATPFSTRQFPIVTHVLSERGWQSSGVVFAKKSVLRLTSSGRFTVHDQPRPWISETSGITIEYNSKHPIGKLMAILVSPDGDYVTARIPVGSEATITVPENHDAELWLQINDSEAKRSGNSGSAEVQIEVMP